MERGDATPNLEYIVILPSRARSVDRPQGSIRPGTIVLPSALNSGPVGASPSNPLKCRHLFSAPWRELRRAYRYIGYVCVSKRFVQVGEVRVHNGMHGIQRRAQFL